MCVMYQRSPCVRRCRKREKIPAADGEELTNVLTMCISYMYEYIVIFGECDDPRWTARAGVSHEKLTNRHTASGTHAQQ